MDVPGVCVDVILWAAFFAWIAWTWRFTNRGDVLDPRDAPM